MGCCLPLSKPSSYSIMEMNEIRNGIDSTCCRSIIKHGDYCKDILEPDEINGFVVRTDQWFDHAMKNSPDNRSVFYLFLKYGGKLIIHIVHYTQCGVYVPHVVSPLYGLLKRWHLILVELVNPCMTNERRVYKKEENKTFNYFCSTSSCNVMDSTTLTNYKKMVVNQFEMMKKKGYTGSGKFHLFVECVGHWIMHFKHYYDCKLDGEMIKKCLVVIQKWYIVLVAIFELDIFDPEKHQITSQMKPEPMIMVAEVNKGQDKYAIYMKKKIKEEPQEPLSDSEERLKKISFPNAPQKNFSDTDDDSNNNNFTAPLLHEENGLKIVSLKEQIKSLLLKEKEGKKEKESDLNEAILN